MANYTTHNSDNKRSKKIQMIHLLPVTSIGGGNASILSHSFKYFYLYFHYTLSVFSNIPILHCFSAFETPRTEQVKTARNYLHHFS